MDLKVKQFLHSVEVNTCSLTQYTLNPPFFFTVNVAFLLYCNVVREAVRTNAVQPTPFTAGLRPGPNHFR